MGKRKLHNHTYYQCDWTGLPMKSANCFMPSWTLENKLIKKGSYCNWESVLAHASHIHSVEKQLEDKDLERIHDFVKVQMGTDINSTSAPHFTDLEHFKCDGTRSLTATEYHDACCKQTNEVFAVKIDSNGHAFELIMDATDGTFDFSKYMSTNEISTFQSYRKGKHKDKDLCVFYHVGGEILSNSGLKFNTFASNLFKMQIYGPVVMVQCTKEASFMPRVRYVDYTLQEFEDNFMRKRKRGAVEVTSLDQAEYGDIKKQMQDSLCAYEKQASSLAAPPAALAKARKMPPANGRQLAKLVKHEAATDA